MSLTRKEEQHLKEEIDAKLLKVDPCGAVKPDNLNWRLEEIVKALPDTVRRPKMPELIKAIEDKIVSVQDKFRQDSRIHVVWGMLYEHLGENEDALREYALAQQKSSLDLYAYLRPAELLKKMERYQECKTLLEAMLNLADNGNTKPHMPKFKEALMQKARTHLQEIEKLMTEATKEKMEEPQPKRRKPNPAALYQLAAASAGPAMGTRARTRFGM